MKTHEQDENERGQRDAAKDPDRKGTNFPERLVHSEQYLEGFQGVCDERERQRRSAPSKPSKSSNTNKSSSSSSSSSYSDSYSGGSGEFDLGSYIGIGFFLFVIFGVLCVIFSGPSTPTVEQIRRSNEYQAQQKVQQEAQVKEEARMPDNLDESWNKEYTQECITGFCRIPNRSEFNTNTNFRLFYKCNNVWAEEPIIKIESVYNGEKLQLYWNWEWNKPDRVGDLSCKQLVAWKN